MQLYERGKKGKTTWHCQGVNRAGAKLPPHTTKCRDKKKALAYIASIDDLTQEQWLAKKAAKAAKKPNSWKGLIALNEPPKGLSLPEAMENWLKRYDNRPSTQEQYRMRVGRELIERLSPKGVHCLNQVRGTHLNDLQLEWIKRGLSLDTIHSYRQASNIMFNFYFKTDGPHQLAKNPWVGVDQHYAEKPTFDEWLDDDTDEEEYENVATAPLDEAEWRLVRSGVVPFCKASKAYKRPLLCRPETFAVLLDLFWESGLRRGDAIAFRPDLIKRGNGCAKYTRKQQKTKTLVTVYLPLKLADRLQALPLLPWLGADRPNAGKYPFWDGSGKNFTVYIQGNLNHPLRKLGQQLKLKDSLHPHRFRDSFAVNRFNAGLSLETVSRLLGHKDPKITQEHYNPYVRSRREQMELQLANSGMFSFYQNAEIEAEFVN